MYITGCRNQLAYLLPNRVSIHKRTRVHMDVGISVCGRSVGGGGDVSAGGGGDPSKSGRPFPGLGDSQRRDDGTCLSGGPEALMPPAGPAPFTDLSQGREAPSSGRLTPASAEHLPAVET